MQLRRDRITFATMIMIPLMQLVLFGYAINTTPRDLPTAVLLQETSDVGRSILAALQNTRYFKVTHQVRDAAEFDRLLPPAPCCSRSRSRRISSARCAAATGRRSWSPRTRPIRWRPARRSARSTQIVTTALRNDHAIPDDDRAAVRDPHACALQSGRLDAAQHRAGPGRHDPDDDHADLHGAVGDARDRARHHGEPAVDADHAGRDHARQDRALCARRLRAGGADRRRRRRCCSACRSSAA